MSKPRGRPTSRADLLQAAVAEFDWLWLSVDQIADERREEPGACAQWSVKDLLAHLHAWQELTIGWERAGAAGKTPAMPAEGYTFATTPELNEAIYSRTKDDAWADVVERLRSSHEALLDIIGSYDDAAIFTKRRYPWRPRRVTTHGRPSSSDRGRTDCPEPNPDRKQPTTRPVSWSGRVRSHLPVLGRAPQR